MKENNVGVWFDNSDYWIFFKFKYLDYSGINSICSWDNLHSFGEIKW